MVAAVCFNFELKINGKCHFPAYVCVEFLHVEFVSKGG